MAVQPLGFGQKLPSTGNSFLRLKKAGDKVQFKIAQQPVYDGKHFMQLTDPDTGEAKWDVTECQRIASGDECEYCNKYFKIMAAVKKFKQAEKVEDDNAEVKRMKKDAQKYAVSISHYFPILNRIDSKFTILQVTNGVKNKFNAQFENGIDVMAKEWILSNTGDASPANRFSLSLVDSADVKPMTPEEQGEFEKARIYDLNTISQSSKSEESSLDDF